jgi:hypothetical protein
MSAGRGSDTPQNLHLELNTLRNLSWYRNNAKYHPLAASLPPLFNCWSLVVDMRVNIFGLPLLPLHGGIHADDKRELSRAATLTIDSHLVESKLQIGAIAAAYRASLCVHVGIVVEIDGRLCIAEIGSKTGFRILSVERFEVTYTKVRYYIDK